MDGGRFDEIARATAMASRRGALRLLAGSALGVLFTRFGDAEVGAEHGCIHVGARCNPRRPGRCCSGSCPRAKKKCRCAVDVCPMPNNSTLCEAYCPTKFTCGFRPKGGGTNCNPGDACIEDTTCTGNGQCVGTPKSGNACPGGECCNGTCEPDLGQSCQGQSCTGTLTCTAQGKVCQCPPPPTLVSVAVDPDPVVIGVDSLGTVTLDGAAQGDTTVNLSVSDAAASVPATATVPGGATSKTFDVTGVSPKDQVVLSATLGSDTVQTTFDVKNPGQ